MYQYSPKLPSHPGCHITLSSLCYTIWSTKRCCSGDVVIVQSLSHVWLFAAPWTAACQASLSITNSQSPPKPMSVESVMPSNYLILCRPLLLLGKTSIRVFADESALRIRWPKYWSFSFFFLFVCLFVFWVSASTSGIPMNIQDWSLGWTGSISLQSKGLSRVFNTTVQKHQFFSAQLSLWSTSHIHTWLLENPWPWVDGPLLTRVMSLLFNMLSRLVITFLPRSKHLLISWLPSPSAVILEPRKI